MYFTPLVLAAATTSATTGLPFIKPPSFDIGVPIQAFGVIVAVGVLIGAAILRRYAEWHGVSDDHIRGITGWITVTGFIGAHVFDVLAYEPHKLDEQIAMWPPSQWPVLFRLWDGISSYGGFVGGAAGFAFYVWWKRLPARLFADICIVGLLPAFSIGRIGCTVVSDHVGAMVDPDAWYAVLAMDYPSNFNNPAIRDLVDGLATKPEIIKAWNLGLVELLYLIPVNALILWLAFRPAKRMPAGFLVVLTGVLYAPVRFFLDYLRPETTDKLHAGLTFAQWCSLVAFGVSVFVAAKVLKSGKPAETVTRTSKEAQERLKVILKNDDDDVVAVDKAASKGTVDKMSDKSAKPKTENVVADAKISPSAEVPADDGAEVDPKAALEQRKAESSIADKSIKSDDKSK